MSQGPSSHSEHPQDPSEVFHEGKWTEEEHAAFLIAIAQYENDWKQIAAEVKTRDASQVRSHAQKYFNKKHNDEEKIGKNKTAIIGDQNDQTNTRGRLRGSQPPKKYTEEKEQPKESKAKKEKSIHKEKERPKENKPKVENRQKTKPVKAVLSSIMEVSEPIGQQADLHIPKFTHLRPLDELERQQPEAYVNTQVRQSYFIGTILPTLNVSGYNLRMIGQLNLYELLDGAFRKSEN